MGRIKEWEELTICDNFLFTKVMQNPRICKRLIEKLLDIKVKEINYPENEKSIDISATQKSVRLDLYVETDTGLMLDIEMQTIDGEEGYLPKRTRYYQSIMDLNALDKGKDYIDLKASYVIFICTFDPFKCSRKVYTFRNKCVEEESLELGDETIKMFLNSKGTVGEVDKDIASFLEYINGRSAEGTFTKEIASEVEHVKEHKETKVEYMTLIMELKHQRREGKAEGKVEGKVEERIHSIRKMMKNLNLTIEQAMDAIEVPVRERAECAALVSAV